MTRATPRLEKEAFRRIFSLLSLHLQFFVNKICVLCQLSNVHPVDVRFLCQRTVGRIRQDKSRSLPRATPRLEKEAFTGILSFFAFTCFAYLSRHLQIFVNKICVHC